MKPYTFSYDCIGKIDNDYVDNIIVRMYFGKVCDGTLSEQQFMQRLNELWSVNSNYKLVKVKAIGDSSKSSTVMDVKDKHAMINIPASWPESPTCDIKANSKCKLFGQCIRYTDVVAQTQSNVGVSGPPSILGIGDNTQQLNCPTGKYFTETPEGGKCLCKNRAGVDQPNNQPMYCDIGYTFNESNCSCEKTSTVTECSGKKFLWDDTTGECFCPPLMCNMEGSSSHWDSDKCDCVKDSKGIDTTTDINKDQNKIEKEIPWAWVALGGLTFVGAIITIAAIKSRNESNYGSSSSGSKQLEEPNIIKKIRQTAINSARESYNSGLYLDSDSYLDRVSKILGRESTDYENQIFVDTFDKEWNILDKEYFASNS